MAENGKTKKTVIISGFAGYLGSEVARRLSKDGFCIAGLYNQSKIQDADNLIKNLSGSGHCAYKCDLKNQKDITKILEEIIKKHGKIGALVHCAWAKSERKQISSCSEKEISEELNGNVLGSFNLLSASAKIFKEQKEGIIIGITTAGVVVPEASKNLGTYIIGKYALQGMLATLKEELFPFVKVYSIAPGFMPGGINSDIPKAFVEIIKQKSPTKKITDAGEVALLISSVFSGKIKQDDMTILIAPEYNKN